MKMTIAEYYAIVAAVVYTNDEKVKAQKKATEDAKSKTK